MKNFISHFRSIDWSVDWSVPKRQIRARVSKYLSEEGNQVEALLIGTAVVALILMVIFFGEWRVMHPQ